MTHTIAQVVAGPFFVLAIVVGLAFAMAFQLLLTNLSAAVGASTLRFGEAAGPTNPHAPHVPLTQRARRLVNGFGVWTALTACVALFCASFLAISLSLVIDPLLASVLALTIWAFFYLAMTGLGALASWSLGGVFGRTVAGTVRGAWSLLGRALARRERLREPAPPPPPPSPRGYFPPLEHPEPAQVRAEVERLFDEAELQAIAADEAPLVSRESMVAALHAHHPELRPHDLRAVAHSIDEGLRVLKEEAFSGKDSVTAVADAALRLTGKSREEAEAVRMRVEAWLTTTGKAELDPDGIKRDLERLVAQPESGLAALRARARMIDRDTIEAVLMQRPDITPEEAKVIVDTVDRWVRTLVGRAESARPELVAARERTVDEVQRRLLAARDEALEQVDEARKTAAAAAWWGVVAAVASAVAAVAGGVLAAAG